MHVLEQVGGATHADQPRPRFLHPLDRLIVGLGGGVGHQREPAQRDLGVALGRPPVDALDADALTLELVGEQVEPGAGHGDRSAEQPGVTHRDPPSSPAARTARRAA